MLSAREHLLAVLSDGQPHACADMAAALDVTPNAIEQAASRLARRGIPVEREGDCYVLRSERRCLACDRPISRYARRPFCTLHRFERRRKRDQQMALPV